MVVVIKIGGSLITNKRKPFTLNRSALEEVVESLASLYNEGKAMVIVHGGGSFGHYAVKRAGGDVRRLVTDVAYWMGVLNAKVVRLLMRRGVPAVGLPTWLIAQGSKGNFHLDKELVLKLLKTGLIPVTHGGLIVTDEGFEILSGDTLASQLAIELPASALVFLMDVEGVYTEDPRVNPSAVLINTLRKSDVYRVKGGSSGIDVTGGLSLKIREALRAAERGVNVALGGVNALKLMVEGAEGRYTRVLP